MTYNISLNCKEHQSFKSVEEMDLTIRKFNRELNKTQYTVLNILSRFSLKVFGVSHIKQCTLANQTELSLATIKRTLKFLKENGYITVINTCRKIKGGKGANLYRINTLKEQKIIKESVNELSLVSHRKSLETLRNKALEYVKFKKESLSYLNLLNTYLSNSKKVNITAQCNTNINQADSRVQPLNVSDNLYYKYRAFFTDKQLSSLVEHIDRKIVGQYLFTFDEFERETAIDYALKSLVKALKTENHGGAVIKNRYAYARSVAFAYLENEMTFI
ncbi:hypothetical protein ACN5ZK_13560 (plasmid) [Macrococcoides bohemicum]|uniref:hypothetical protein n=1 Tax=Macrococcoides bohemicum TaxID=1903056 RepID=UPI003B00501B